MACTFVNMDKLGTKERTVQRLFILKCKKCTNHGERKSTFDDISKPFSKSVFMYS